MTDDSKEQTEEKQREGQSKRPTKYQPVYVDPLDRSAPDEHKMRDKKNWRRVLGESDTAQGIDFDPFAT